MLMKKVPFVIIDIECLKHWEIQSEIMRLVPHSITYAAHKIHLVWTMHRILRFRYHKLIDG